MKGFVVDVYHNGRRTSFFRCVHRHAECAPVGAYTVGREPEPYTLESYKGDKRNMTVDVCASCAEPNAPSL
jgi:hypothetical protein